MKKVHVKHSDFIDHLGSVKHSVAEVNDRSKLKLEVFKEICKSISTLSYDDKYKVGTIIITEDFRDICAIGYNGNYKGGPNKRDSEDTGMSGFLHAEENCLLHLSKPYELRDKLIMICTHKPCPMCAKRIVNAGIKKVLYIKDYTAAGDGTAEIFKNANVEVEKF